MANSYTSFATAVTVTTNPDLVIEEYGLLVERWNDHDPEEPAPDLEEALGGVDDDYAWYGTLPAMFLIGEAAVGVADDAGEGDVDLVCRVVQWLQRNHGAPAEVFIEWAFTCSKSRPGEFGGGAARITPDSVTTITTGAEVIADLLRTMALNKADT